jgi:PAS domain S-box-containing protein
VEDITECMEQQEALRKRNEDLEKRVEELTAALAAKALLDSEDILRSITSAARDAIVVIDDQGKISFWNAAAVKMLGWNESEVVGRDLHLTLAPQSYHSTCRLGMEHFVRTGRGDAVGKTLELQALRRDNTEIPVELSLSSVKVGGHWHGVGIIRDISERKKVEESLQASEERYRIFTSITSDYVFKCCRQETKPYRIQWMAGAVESITGYSEREIYEMGCWMRIVHADDVERIGAQLMEYAPGERGTAKFRIITKSGQVRWLKESCYCEKGRTPGELLLYGTSQDITEQEMLHTQLLKNQKLESLGVLAGGIAHDFNNLLTGIIANISLAKIFVNPEEKAFKRLEEAEKAADSAKELTQHLLTFSKGGDPVKKIASIEQLVMDSASFVLRGSNVRCEFLPHNDIWQVEVDVGQINQVVNNLIINADQSMPEGGIIRVCLENLTLDTNEIVPVKAGRYVKLTIEDRGIGIPDEYQSKIFDPYFTTKQKGSGLGLATVHSIIKKHDGHICVESKVGFGTAFHVYLPASMKELPRTIHKEVKHHSGYGKILLMDDDETIRDVANEILGHLGYRVALCNDGNEALALYRQAMEQEEPFDVVIMDLTVPGGMGGKEAMKNLLEINNEAKGIVSSGYCNDPILSNYREYGFSGVVTKPYNFGELSEIVHDLISHP